MDDAWLLFPLALIVMMTGANPLSPVPLLMLLLSHAHRLQLSS